MSYVFNTWDCLDHSKNGAWEPKRVLVAATGYQAARFQKKLNELSRAVIQVPRQFLVLSNRSLMDFWWVADRLLMDFNGKVVKFEWPTFLIILIQVFVDFGFDPQECGEVGRPLIPNLVDGNDMFWCYCLCRICKFLPPTFTACWCFHCHNHRAGQGQKDFIPLSAALWFGRFWATEVWRYPLPEAVETVGSKRGTFEHLTVQGLEETDSQGASEDHP